VKLPPCCLKNAKLKLVAVAPPASIMSLSMPRRLGIVSATCVLRHAQRAGACVRGAAGTAPQPDRLSAAARNGTWSRRELLSAQLAIEDLAGSTLGIIGAVRLASPWRSSVRIRHACAAGRAARCTTAPRPRRVRAGTGRGDCLEPACALTPATRNLIMPPNWHT